MFAPDKGLVPKLRFPEFKGEWKRSRIRDLFVINVGGDIDKNKVSPEATKATPYPIIANALSNDGIYGYTSEFKEEAPCITVTGRGEVGCAKYRDYPLYPIVRLLVLHSKGKIDCKFGEHAINTIRKYEESTGVPQLTAPQLGAYSIYYPDIDEQIKIGELLALLNQRIKAQSRAIEKLQFLISGITQKVSKHPSVQKTMLSDVLMERNEKNQKLLPVYSVSVSEGIVNQVEYLGRSFAAKDTSNYNVVYFGDIVYTKSPTGEFPFGIVKRSNNADKVAVSPLYGVYQPSSEDIGVYLHYYFCSSLNANNYLHKLIQKGAKNTINITNQRFLENEVPIPDSITLRKYVVLMTSLSKKLEQEKNLLALLQTQKQFLLQEMFI